MRIGSILLALVYVAGVEAHTASDSYLYVDQAIPQALRLDVAVQDLQLLLDLDADRSGSISWGEVENARPAVTTLIRRGLRMSTRNGDCGLDVQLVGMVVYREQPYASSLVRARCPGGEPARSLIYSLLFERDSLHRAVVTRKVADQYEVDTLSPEQSTLRLSGDVPLVQRMWQRIRPFLTRF